MTRLSTPLRWFWRIYIPIAALALLGFTAVGFGPSIETSYRPIRGPEQRVDVIERTPTRVCWAWTFTKLRQVASDNLDAFLVINGQPGGVASVFEMESGRPWGLTKYAVPPRAAPYTLHECTALPPYVQASDTLVVQQTAFYPGLAGLWRLPVAFPDVVSAGVPGP